MKSTLFASAVALGLLVPPLQAHPEDAGILAQAIKSCAATKAREVPAVDGVLNDPCWKDAAFSSDFLDFKSKAPAGQRTEFAFCFDSDNLYLALRCKTSDGYKAVASPKFWDGDLVECFLDPGASGHDYFHFAATPAGMVFKERGYGRSDCLWAPRVRAAGHVEKGEWTLEVALPFADFQFQEPPGPTWLVNVARLDKERDSSYYTWAPSFNDLHQVSTFQPLKGLDLDVSRFLWEATLEGDGLISPSSPPTLSLKNHAATKQAIQLTLRVQLVGAPYPTTASLGTFEVEANGATPVPIPQLFPERGRYLLSLEGKDAKDHLVFRSQNYELEAPAEPIRLSSDQRAYYRNEGVCKAEARLFSPWKEGTEIHFSLKSDTGREKAWKEAPVDKDGRAAVEFDLKGLEPGEYKLVATWRGQADAKSSLSVLDRELRPSGVSLRQDGTMLLDGKPFMPRGLFMPNPWYEKTSLCPTDETDWADIKAKGFNVMKYSPFWEKSFMHPGADGSRISPEERRRSWEVLDRMDKTGLKVAMVVNQFCCFAYDLDGLRDYVSEFRGHPAVLCWYLADEPDLGGIPPQRLEQAYRIIKEVDPSRPVCMVAMGAFAPYRDATDIMMADKYPIHDSDSRPNSTVHSITKAGVRSLKPGQAFWMVPQFFCNYPQEEWKRCPTVEESILMAFQAVCGGAKGIMHFAYSPARQRSQEGAPSPYPLVGKRLSWELWEGSKRMNQLLIAAEPFILDGTKAPDIVVEKAGGDPADPMQTLALRHGDEALVILCNSSGKAAKAKIGGLAPWKNAECLGEETRKLEVKDGGLLVDLPPWSARLVLCR